MYAVAYYLSYLKITFDNSCFFADRLCRAEDRALLVVDIRIMRLDARTLACTIHRLRIASSPDFISQPWRNFSPWLRDKIWEWPGDEASLRMRYASASIPRPHPLTGRRARVGHETTGQYTYKMYGHLRI